MIQFPLIARNIYVKDRMNISLNPCELVLFYDSERALDTIVQETGVFVGKF